VLATVAIFLPSFVFVALIGPLVPRLRRSPWLSGMLDGVNASAFGLMAAVTITLGRDAIVDWWTAAMAIVAAVWLIGFRPQSAWLIALGALGGAARHYLIG
jgi:chromate transporter